MQKLVLVMAGGAIGAGARLLVSEAARARLGPDYPWGTLIANVSGGLLMGVLAGLLARMGEGGETWRLLLGVGLLGGFTTFSAFSLESFAMIERGALGQAAAYVALSAALSIAALALGLAVVRAAS